MYQAVIVIHVLLGLGVIGLVLLQQGKGADAGAAFGSASSGSVFGAQGASSFLSRATAILATLFFSTSLGLAVWVGHLDDVADLMDPPVVEEVRADDVPLIDGVNNSVVGDSAPVVEGNSMPVINEELPAEALQIQEEISSMADSLKTDAESLVGEVKAVISNEVDAVTATDTQ